MNSKICTKCKQRKSFDNFNKEKNAKDKKRSWCKKCVSLQQKAYRSNPKIQQSMKEYRTIYKADLENKKKAKQQRYEYSRSSKGRFIQAKIHAKRANHEFNLTNNEYVIFMTKSCYYCDGKLNETGVGLDRKDSSKGYLLDNVVPCCTICNRVKGAHFSVEEMLELKPSLIKLRLKREQIADDWDEVKDNPSDYPEEQGSPIEWCQETIDESDEDF